MTPRDQGTAGHLAIPVKLFLDLRKLLLDLDPTRDIVAYVLAFFDWSAKDCRLKCCIARVCCDPPPHSQKEISRMVLNNFLERQGWGEIKRSNITHASQAYRRNRLTWAGWLVFAAASSVLLSSAVIVLVEKNVRLETRVLKKRNLYLILLFSVI